MAERVKKGGLGRVQQIAGSLLNLTEIQRENFQLVEQAEEQVKAGYEMVFRALDAMNKASAAMTEARYRMWDPIVDAKIMARAIRNEAEKHVA